MLLYLFIAKVTIKLKVSGKKKKKELIKIMVFFFFFLANSFMVSDVDNFDGRTNQSTHGKISKSALLPTPGSPAMSNGLFFPFKYSLKNFILCVCILFQQCKMSTF